MDTKIDSSSDDEHAASATTNSEATLCGETTTDGHAKENSDDTKDNSEHAETNSAVHLNINKHQSLRSMGTKTDSSSDAQDSASSTTTTEATLRRATTTDENAKENSEHTKESLKHAEKTSAVYPNISTQAEKEAFLREMLQPFVNNVHPLESGLIDQLMQDDLLSGSDYSLLPETKDRRMQVRKLWLIFSKMEVEDFNSLVFPWLYENFHHIIPMKFCSEEPVKTSTETLVPCLRHLLMERTKPNTFLDLFYRCGCVSQHWFSDVISDIPKMMTAQLWYRLFEVFRNFDDSLPWQTLESGIITSLRYYKFQIPQDLRKQLCLGVPCTCRVLPEDFPLDISLSEETERPLQTPRDFQVEGSQFLGSDDSQYSHHLDPVYLSWARAEGLPDITLWKLMKEGIKNKEELGSLTQYKLSQLRLKLNLTKTDVDLVSKAIRKLSLNAGLQDFFETSGEPCQGNEMLSLQGSLKVKIILVGKTGSGKSSSANTIVGKDGGKFDECLSMSSQTRKCQFEKSSDGTVEVIDCPGLFDTGLSMNAACEIIIQAFVAMHPGPDVCLYALKIGDKYTAEEYGTYKRLKAIFGKNITRIMIVLFTRGDDLDQKGITIEKYIETAPKEFKQVLKECNHRYVVFDNTPTGANREQLQELWARIQQVKDQDRSSTEDRFSTEAVSRFSSNKTKRRREVRRHLREVLKDEYEAKKSFMHANEKMEHMQELIRLLRRFLHQIAQFFMGEIGETDC